MSAEEIALAEEEESEGFGRPVMGLVEAARRYKMNIYDLSALVHSGHVPCVMKGNRMKIHEKDLEEWFRAEAKRQAERRRAGQKADLKMIGALEIARHNDPESKADLYALGKAKRKAPNGSHPSEPGD